MSSLEFPSIPEHVASDLEFVTHVPDSVLRLASYDGGGYTLRWPTDQPPNESFEHASRLLQPEASDSSLITTRHDATFIVPTTDVERYFVGSPQKHLPLDVVGAIGSTLIAWNGDTGMLEMSDHTFNEASVQPFVKATITPEDTAQFTMLLELTDNAMAVALKLRTRQQNIDIY